MDQAGSAEKPGFRITDRWAFYVCNELDCGFFYNNQASQPAPIAEVEVLVVAIGKKVKLIPIGRGEAGYQELVEQGMANSIFPVDFFHFPFCIDVKVSRTVPPELHERWLKLIAFYKKEPFVSERREYVRVMEDGKIVQRKLCTEPEYQKVLGDEANRRARNANQGTLGVWRLATDEERVL